MLKKKLALACGIAMVAGLLAAAGCAPQPMSDTGADAGKDDTTAAMETGLMPEAGWQTNPSDNPDDFLGDIYAGYDERAAEYPVEVLTLEDGTKVQRTPAPVEGQRDSTANVKDNISWNTYRLKADSRGCLSCHDNLDDLVLGINGAAHPQIANLGIETEVHQCMACHETHLGGRYQSQFSGLIHGIHENNAMFDSQGGTCWSCHYGYTDPETTKMELWDEVKHKVLRGITTIAAEDMEGDFTSDQEYCQSPDEPLWSYDYMSGRDNQVAATRWGQSRLGLVSDPSADGAYDSWVITIGGEVDNPVTMTLAELMEAIPSETRKLQVQCANNGANSTYITQKEVTGIPVSAIAELVGVKDSVLTMGAESADGRTAEVDYNWVKEHGAYLVYEVDGKPLSYGAGYPVQLWIAGWVADEFNKNIVALDFTNEEYEPPVFYQGAFSTKLGVKRQPNAGICYLHEGQMIKTGEPFTFQGYASSIGHAITSIEISMDHGKTWKMIETPNNDLTKWNWWNYTFTPETDGSYCITVRCTDDQGVTTPDPHEYMVTARAEV